MPLLCADRVWGTVWWLARDRINKGPIDRRIRTKFKGDTIGLRLFLELTCHLNFLCFVRRARRFGPRDVCATCTAGEAALYRHAYVTALCTYNYPFAACISMPRRPLARFLATASSHSFNTRVYIQYAGNCIFYCGDVGRCVWRRISTCSQGFLTTDCPYFGGGTYFGDQGRFKQLQVPGNSLCAATDRRPTSCVSCPISSSLYERSVCLPDS